MVYSVSRGRPLLVLGRRVGIGARVCVIGRNRDVLLSHGDLDGGKLVDESKLRKVLVPLAENGRGAARWSWAAAASSCWVNAAAASRAVLAACERVGENL